ncbi:retrovirus-related pol polyprotein from transposon TNT 1-94 [Tanacetum coccineum]
MEMDIGYSNMSDLDDIEDIDLVMQLINEDQQVQGESSSRSRKAINRKRDVAEARLMADYFAHDPLPAHFIFFVVQPDATGLMGFSVIIKCTSAISQLAYKTSPDALDEYLQIGEHCARDCLDFFTMCIIDLFTAEFLRKPDVNDIRTLYAAHNSVHGLLGMLGSIDCCLDCSLVSGLRMFKTYDRESLSAHQFCSQVSRIPKLKFEKDHLCSACAMGKSKKQSHKPKSEDTNKERLYLLHMDLCGPMRVASVNGKKYILVIVDDYSRFTWVEFLASKDEAPDFIIKFLKMIQVRLNAIVRNICTDNGTEFVNQTLRRYYKSVGISHETSVARTPQQNGVVERRNRTLVEAARTILEPALHEITSATPPAPFVPLSRNEWDLVFLPVFDEFFSPSASVASPVPAVKAPAPVESTSTASSTSVDQDAPSLKTVSEESSSSVVIPTTVHSDTPILEHLSKWTKDHPLQNIIGELSRPVSIRLQLHE